MVETAFIALGSNLGDSAAILRAAFEELPTLTGDLVAKSSLWASEPMDCPPGSPRFLNAVAAITVGDSETPETLLKKLQAIENKFGRSSRKIRNEPRLLDLDLIAFGSQVLESPDLILPHPRAYQRLFVMGPLAEIAPDFILPGQSKTAREVAEILRRDSKMETCAIKFPAANSPRADG